jgi:hypothetical protein
MTGGGVIDEGPSWWGKDGDGKFVIPQFSLYFENFRGYARAFALLSYYFKDGNNSFFRLSSILL